MQQGPGPQDSFTLTVNRRDRGWVRPGAKEATAVAKLKPNETWYPIALESEQ